MDSISLQLVDLTSPANPIQKSKSGKNENKNARRKWTQIWFLFRKTPAKSDEWFLYFFYENLVVEGKNMMKLYPSALFRACVHNRGTAWIHMLFKLGINEIRAADVHN